MKKRIFFSLLTGLMAATAAGQTSTTVSPYSQFGMGQLADQSTGFNRAMGGVAYGLRDGRQVNMQNPASYSCIDSLTMIFDAGVAGQFSSLKEDNKRVNTKTSAFDYGVASFRLFRKVGMAAGVVPFSRIGYGLSQTKPLGNSLTAKSYIDQSGSGGFSQAFVGVGAELWKGFSVGANISYFWGSYDKSISVSSNDTYVNSTLRTYSASISNYKLDLGVQWQRPVGKNDVLTLGATASIGHNLSADATMTSTNTSSMTGTGTTNTQTVANAFKLPTMVGVGFSLLHRQSLTVAADYSLQRWSTLDMPVFNSTTGTYVLQSDCYKDRHKVAAGIDWIPDNKSRKFLNHVHYRAGASLATPYYKIEGKDGPTELTVGAGVGIPIFNTWNNRSQLNITAQWVRTAASGFVTDNTLRITIGLTFNERWFAKWKVD